MPSDDSTSKPTHPDLSTAKAMDCEQIPHVVPFHSSQNRGQRLVCCVECNDGTDAYNVGDEGLCFASLTFFVSFGSNRYIVY